MTDDNNSDTDTNHHQDVASRIESFIRDEGDGTGGADDPASAEQDVDSFNNNVPVFLDRTFRMIENVPDDVVCWSEAGDSFIIKQASKCLKMKIHEGWTREAPQTSLLFVMVFIELGYARWIYIL